jgi:hypothetical protein
MKAPESKWIYFEDQKLANRKTKMFEVLTKDGNINLGTISWFARWRKYCFFSNTATVFETQCLKDIIAYIDYLMEERKAMLRFADKTGFDLVDEDAVS